ERLRLGDLARHRVEVLEGERDLVEIDPREAELLGERAERVGLLDEPLLEEARRERRAVFRRKLALLTEGVIEIRLRDQSLLEQDFAKLLLLLGQGPGIVSLVSVPLSHPFLNAAKRPEAIAARAP